MTENAEHGIAGAAYNNLPNLKPEPMLMCLCGRVFREPTWGDAGEALDAHLSEVITVQRGPYGAWVELQRQKHAVASMEEDEKEFFCYWLARVYEAGHRDTSYEEGETLSEALRNINQVLGFAGYEPDDGSREALLNKSFGWQRETKDDDAKQNLGFEHLEERLKTVDDFVGYLSAAFTEGKDAFYLAVRDVTLITHGRAAQAALEQAAQTVIDFDDWKGCGCSECKADARSHAVNESESMASLAMEIRALKPDAATGDDK